MAAVIALAVVATGGVFLLGALTGPSTSPPPIVTPTSSPTFSSAPPTLGPSPTSPAALAPWPPEPTHDARYVPIGRLQIGADGRDLVIGFGGWRPFSPSDGCSADYAATTRVVANVLEIGVYESRRAVVPNWPGCDTIAYDREVDVDLAEPFTGGAWRDLYGPYVHFLRPPSGLVELTNLPAGWQLREQGDVEDSPSGRWQRVYSPDPTLADATKILRVFQSFGGPVNVSGGTEGRQVIVNGQPATLYRYPPTGELVLVWRLGESELAVVANEASFSADDLLILANAARAP
jgi:hypothetical protein